MQTDLTSLNCMFYNMLKCLCLYYASMSQHKFKLYTVNNFINVKRRKWVLSAVSQRWFHSYGWVLRQSFVLQVPGLWLPNCSFQSCHSFIVHAAVLQQEVHLPSRYVTSPASLSPSAPHPAETACHFFSPLHWKQLWELLLQWLFDPPGPCSLQLGWVMGF